MRMGKPNNMFSSIMQLLSDEKLSHGCLSTYVLEIFLAILTSSTTGLSGFETSDRGHRPGFYVAVIMQMY